MEQFLSQLQTFWEPHPGQREFLLSDSKFRVLACGRRWGKTDACAVDVLAALHRPSPTRHLIVAPTLDQARLLFDRIVELLDQMAETGALDEPHKLKRSPYPSLTLGPHRLTARSGHLGYALRGQEATHIVIDEAAYVAEELVTDIAMPMLATTNGSITLISTPKGKNHFWRFFQMGERGEHDVWSRRAPTSENPFVAASFLAMQRELISDRAYLTEYEAEFFDAQGKVFPQERVDEATKLVIEPEPTACVRIGIDWARYGDRTVVAVVAGHEQAAKLIEIRRYHDQSWTKQVENVAAIIQQYANVIVLCDKTGMGDPVLEMLQRRLPNHPIEGLVFTTQSKRQLIDQLVAKFDRGTLSIPSEPELLKELEYFEINAGRTSDKFGAKSGYHDDMVIALALATSRLPKNVHVKIALGNTREFSQNRPVSRRRKPLTNL